MKSMRLFGIGLAAIMLASMGALLTGCGNKDDSAATTPSPAAVASPAADAVAPQKETLGASKPATK